jgi:bacterioferritin (cytochrome b1)
MCNYLGFTIRKSKVDKKYYAFNNITGNKKNGSSKTFLANSLNEIREMIEKFKENNNQQTWSVQSESRVQIPGSEGKPKSADRKPSDKIGGFSTHDEIIEKELLEKEILSSLQEKIENKDFIMSILFEDVTIDEEERMKFIDVEGVRKKFSKIFKEMGQ